MSRSDGYRVHSNDPMYEIQPHIMPKRYDASNYLKLEIDLDPIQDYINEKRAAGESISHMAVLIAAYVRLVSQNPGLNRFVVNKKIYARNHFCVCFVTLSEDGKGETVNKVYFNLDDTIDQINAKLTDAIEKTKTSQDNSMDRMAKTLTRIPGLLRVTMNFLKLWDRTLGVPFWGVDASPFHTSLFVTNLASIRMNSVYHHMYDFGTTSVFISMGMPTWIPVFKDEASNKKKIMELGVTVDDRIVDGHYYARCFREFSKYLKNPKLLETPPEKIIRDEEIREKNPKWIVK